MIGFNGWTNHATWCVNLHLDNDPVTYEAVRSDVRRAVSTARAEAYLSLDRARLLAAELAVKEYVEIMLDGVCPSDSPADLLARDMVRGYLEDVNFREIAEAMIDELELA